MVFPGFEAGADRVWAFAARAARWLNIEVAKPAYKKIGFFYLN
jgi:hypothetical protein